MIKFQPNLLPSEAACKDLISPSFPNSRDLAGSSDVSSESHASLIPSALPQMADPRGTELPEPIKMLCSGLTLPCEYLDTSSVHL